MTAKVCVVALDDVSLRVDRDCDAAALLVAAEVVQAVLRRNREAIADVQRDVMLFGIGAWTVDASGQMKSLPLQSLPIGRPNR